jgi:hypothetical protein
MTTRVDELNTHYLIPGVDLGPSAVADAEHVEDDWVDAPYSQVPPVGEMPSPTGWQDLLGLNQVAPDPSRIDPPPRPPSLQPWPTADVISRLLRFSGNVTRESAGAPRALSLKVERMFGVLARYERASRYIRARGSEGGGL